MAKHKQVEEVAVEEIQNGESFQTDESAPVEEVASDKKTKVSIKSLEFKPRGKAGSYRAGGVYVLEASEAKELLDAGIANLVEEDCKAELTFPTLDEQ